MVRLFIAFELPPPVLDAVEAEIGRLKGADADVRWASRDHLHVTMRFLGEVPEASIRGVEHLLRTTCGGSERFALEARGVGAFPTVARPRVVWAGVDGIDDRSRVELRRVRAVIDEAAAGLGFLSDREDFTAHLTLGRVKGPKKTAPLTELIQADRARDFGRFPVLELVLFESKLTREGSIYTPLVRAALGPGPGHIPDAWFGRA